MNCHNCKTACLNPASGFKVEDIPSDDEMPPVVGPWFCPYCLNEILFDYLQAEAERHDEERQERRY